MSAAAPRARRTTLAVFIRWGGTLLSLGLFIWLVLRLKWGDVLAQLVGVQVGVIALALGCYLLSQSFNTLRWCALLWAQGVRISFWQAFRITWSGIFTSNFLPSTIGGDGLRMVAVLPYTQSKALAIGSVVLDRLINMACYACLLPLPLALFGARLSLLPRPWGGAAALALPFNMRALAEKYFPKIAGALREWASRPRAFVWAFLAAWPSNLAAICATYLIARQLGMAVTFVQVMAVQTVAYFVTVLPVSVNGYGVREVTYTTLFVALGASLEQASAVAVVTRFLAVLITIPGALWVSTVAADVASLDEAG
jgi:uncharacterized membrane protein YbhN (UPF0104 family)